MGKVRAQERTLRARAQGGGQPGLARVPLAAPPCGPLEFPCGSGECAPRGWLCDGEEDCADGSDEHGCGWPCVSPAQLCDGEAHCPDGSDEGPAACGESPALHSRQTRSFPTPTPTPAAQPGKSHGGVPSSEPPLIFFMTLSLKTFALPPRPKGEKKGAFALAHIWARRDKAEGSGSVA